jgi:hypothetical protein
VLPEEDAGDAIPGGEFEDDLDDGGRVVAPIPTQHQGGPLRPLGDGRENGLHKVFRVPRALELFDALSQSCGGGVGWGWGWG